MKDTLRVVVIGAGFAGLHVVQKLKRAPVSITLIDKNNYHLFQPLLYQIATAGLSPADIAVPIRSIFNDQANTTVLLGEVTGVNPLAKSVQLQDKQIPYDQLVLATGARHSYFGHPEWESVAPGLKSIEDATIIRKRILLAFERAEAETDPEKQKEWLTFLIVGAGPTGVELSGAIAELARRVLTRDFRRIRPESSRIILVEAGPHVLPSFSADLSLQSLHFLEELGVEVRRGARVENISSDGVDVSGEWIKARTVLWAAGVQATSVGMWLGLTTDRAGRVQVGPQLTVPEYPDIFVLGDAALFQKSDGKPLPGVAPVAMQEGAFAARVIAARAKGKPAPKLFVYEDKGNLSTIGRSRAVAEFKNIRLAGFFAWVMWLTVHIFYLIGFKNKVFVFLQWTWSYLTFKRGARLITFDSPEEIKKLEIKKN